jgi:hypothetical protein
MARAKIPARAVTITPGLKPDGYIQLSMRPLYILVFLLPLIILYEVGSVVYLSGGKTGIPQTIKAHRLVEDLVHVLGAAGLYLPAAALVTVLFIWHFLVGDKWRIKPLVVATMAVESLVWTLPLLVLGSLHMKTFPESASAAAAATTQVSESWMSLKWQARATIAVGAGIYEEMLFRLVGVALMHFVLADVVRLKDSIASGAAVVVAAVAFALYHQVRLEGGGMNWPWMLFLTAAGLYFGMLYILRGFGITVGTHALYDVLVLVLLPRSGL